MRFSALLVAAFASLLPVPDAGAAATGWRAEVTAAPCPALPRAAADAIEARPMSCGTVRVPDQGGGDDHAVSVSFAVFHARGDAPAGDAIAYVDGGPGAGAVLRAARQIGHMEPLRQQRDVVVLSLREGDVTLRCLDGIAAAPDELSREIAALHDVAVLRRETVAACAAELATRDVAPGIMAGPGIGTVRHAAALRAAMQALGYRSYNLHTVSHGTRIGLEIMRSAPDGLRAALLDGVQPPDVPVHDALAVPLAVSIQSLFDQCTEDVACSTDYPDLRDRFWRLVAQLDAAPAVSRARPLTGRTLLRIAALRGEMPEHAAFITAWLPFLVGELEAGRTDAAADLLMTVEPALPPDVPITDAVMALPTREARLAALLRLAAQREPAPDAAALVAAARLVLQDALAFQIRFCREDAGFNSMEGAIANNRMVVADFGWPPSARDPYNHLIEDLQASCDVFPANAESDIHDPVSSPVPVMVFAGAADVTAQPDWGLDTAAQLENARAVVFPGAGAGTVAFSPCAQAIAAAFFGEPEVPIDFSCAGAPRPGFVRPDGTLPGG